MNRYNTKTTKKMVTKFFEVTTGLSIHSIYYRRIYW